MKPFLLKLIAIIVVFVDRAGNILNYFFFFIFSPKFVVFFWFQIQIHLMIRGVCRAGRGIILLKFKPTRAV